MVMAVVYIHGLASLGLSAMAAIEWHGGTLNGTWCAVIIGLAIMGFLDTVRWARS